MFKHLIAIAPLAFVASMAAAQAASSPAPAAAASAPKKQRLHAPKLRPGAKPAVNPEGQLFKKGGA